MFVFPWFMFRPWSEASPCMPSANEPRSPSSALEGAGALVPFFEQLSHPPENMSLHILQYGDSHTASDDWANQMRQDFQAKFGAGGPGYTLPGHPFLGYRRFDSRGSNSRGWYTSGIVTRKSDGIDGLGGVSLTSQSAGRNGDAHRGVRAAGTALLAPARRRPNGIFGGWRAHRNIDTDGEDGTGCVIAILRRPGRINICCARSAPRPCACLAG